MPGTDNCYEITLRPDILLHWKIYDIDIKAQKHSGNSQYFERESRIITVP